ncbi:sensor kinase CusS [Escherichia coli]|uniref:Sensor kinase CusS n=1 Tax=Escherichia coli TaxID=562 RepID=A0A377DIR6_ECOLX|nr:sensor kinase CusS [Escherichia coli]
MVSKPFQRPFSLATRLTFFISLATIAAFFRLCMDHDPTQ